MKVHVFVNTPSPAVATYSPRKTVENEESDVKNYVMKNFYVDDGLISLPSSAEAISLLKKTQGALKNARIRLHKIVSNHVEVMEAFPSGDLEKNLISLDIGSDDLPVQHSLGLSWDINSDSFTYNTRILEKPFTKRGLLSVVNSLFESLGFIAPIVTLGRILYREGANATGVGMILYLVTRGRVDKMEGLPHFSGRLTHSKNVNEAFLSRSHLREIHVFSYASEKAISAVVYLRRISNSGDVHVGFVIGKCKKAPLQTTTIPRLELCAAVLGTKLAQTVFKHLNIDPDAATYYTDSKAVLGYLNNQTRRFYNYVSSRVAVIHRRSKPLQWKFVPTAQNQAAIGTRCLTSVEELAGSDWLRGPLQLRSPYSKEEVLTFPMVSPEEDKDVRPEVYVKKTEICTPFVARFEHFSTWKSLVRAVSNLKKICRLKRGAADSPTFDVEVMQEAEHFILQEVQAFFYKEEIRYLKDGKPVTPSSSIATLNPFMDKRGTVRVGRRLNQSNLPVDEYYYVTRSYTVDSGRWV